MSTEEPTANPDGPVDPAEEMKRKFREALERKNARSRGKGTAHLEGDSSVHAAQGPASHQREFRRKSG